MIKNRILYLVFGLILIGSIVGALLIHNSEPPPLQLSDLKGIVIISPPVSVPDVQFTDHNGQNFDRKNLMGKWSLMFFGYTNCPDVCPSTLMTFKQVAKQLPASEVQYILTSLDPKRDTPEKLKGYIEYFNPEFIGLSGSKSDLDQISESFGIIYDYEGDTDSDHYFVNHYTAILVIDPKGRLRAHILPPHPASKIVKAVSSIRDYYGN